MDNNTGNVLKSQYPLAQLLLHRFRGRQDAYLSQLPDGSYIAVKDPVTPELVQRHLKGEVTVGTYMLCGNEVGYATIDFDGRENTYLETLKEPVLIVKRLLNHFIIDCLVVDSGRKGYHLHVFFESPIEAKLARQLLRGILCQAERDTGFPMLRYEVFPKQDTTHDGFGNTPKLPCGINQKSGRRCAILDDTFAPVEDEAKTLAGVAPTPIDLVLNALDELPELEHKIPEQQGTIKATNQGLSCVAKMLMGVPEGCRDQVAFTLAKHLKRQGMPQNVAAATLLAWNEQNMAKDGQTPAPLGKQVIEEKVKSAYSHDYRGYDCDNPLIVQFCDPSCPVRTKRDETVEAQAIPPPGLEDIELPSSVWTGLVAEYRDLVAHTTEAPDAYHYGVFMVVLGATLGRRIYVYYANPTYPNFYICKVGTTGLARKGTAWRRGRRLLRLLHSPEEEEEPHFWIIPGIGSAEGLLDALNGQSKVVVVAEEEFRSLLTKARQEGLSNLIPKLTTLFDCPEVETLQTRQRRVIAKEPFLSIITGTTTAWLEKSLSESDIYGGFANRFLYIVGEPKDPMAFPVPVDKAKETELTKKINDIRLWAEEIKASPSNGEITVTDEAKHLFEDYYGENYQRSKNETLDGVLIRRAPAYAWKFALLYAAINMSPEIMVEHLKPAIDASRFFEDCVGRVFCNFGDSATAALEKKILHILREAGGALPRREIYTKMHISAMELDRVTTGMKKLGLIEEFTQPKKRGPVAVSYRLV